MIDEEKCDLCEKYVYCSCGCKLCPSHVEDQKQSGLIVSEFKKGFGVSTSEDSSANGVNVCVCCGLPSLKSHKGSCGCRYCVFCLVHNDLWTVYMNDSTGPRNYTDFKAKYSKPPLDKDGYQIDGVF